MISLKDAKASFSYVIDQAAAGEFVTITRHGRAAAVVVSVKAAEEAKKAIRKGRPSLVQYLKTFPADFDPTEDVFSRNPAPSREVDL
ncbi:prevent-host-death family protein (plasmid) [Rhizobium tropici CIAT 899]|nr:prevent-host-death family protein [Rhizobium tropici CIAT 899]